MEGGNPQIRPITAAGEWALKSANLSTFHTAMYLMPCFVPSHIPSESHYSYFSRILSLTGRKMGLVGGTMGTAAFVATAMQNSRHCEDGLNYGVSGLAAAGLWSRAWGLSKRAVFIWAFAAGLLGPFLFSPSI